MLKRLMGAALCAGLCSGSAMAACVALPVQLTNGTTANADDVMSNFNAVNNCAAAATSPTFTGTMALHGPNNSFYMEMDPGGSGSFLMNNVGNGTHPLLLNYSSGQAVGVGVGLGVLPKSPSGRFLSRMNRL
jgi:hypothetical protein